ncbi:MAG: glycoside hydrolase family 127 protein [Anaerolineae bacterium]|nr:glycoside hydrolase family 127 protein [Phycisphaerae bacterium]
MATIVDTSRSPNAKQRPVSISAVKLNDSFWQPRRETNRIATIPSQYARCESTHRIDNFRRASGAKQGDFVGIYFNDSDVYKWLEAASFSLAFTRDSTLQKMVDDTIDVIAAAQQPDGYLNTYFMFDLAKERWTNLKDKHEMYCAGHLIQAAVAHHRATGSDKLLVVATKLADHICNTFGPEVSRKRPGCCGHEEIEMALVELYRTTRDSKYLDQAKYFVDARGHSLVGGGEYHQDHKPVREMDRMTGHAVRQVYLACAMADLCAEIDDVALRAATERLWQNMTSKQMYITGGIGSRHEGEAFGRDYELPNERAYTETCAAIGSVMWNWRMLLLTGEWWYADVLERTLYNAVLPGLSLDGQSYFYQNPLADDGSHRRQPWFGCACCPPNVARLLAQLPGYFYSTRGDDQIFTHLYASNSAEIPLGDRTIKLEQTTNYPWDGRVAIKVNSAGRFALDLRIPNWSRGAMININGQTHDGSKIDRDWRAGDEVVLDIPIGSELIEAHPHVAENTGRVAIMRGPLVYCAESIDNPQVDLRDIELLPGVTISAQHDSPLLNGVTTLKARAVIDAPVKNRPTYESVKQRLHDRLERDVTFIPHYAWANRAAGRMQVWHRASR